MQERPDADAGRPETPQFQPYVPATQRLAEITIKAVVLGIVLSIALAGANAYLGLLAGMTVSASIPAAVISMAVLRMIGRSNILENNIVQTAASAGESLAAGVIFTFPALVILKAWDTFNYWETTLIAGLGGIIGVLFTIPLRRALVVDSPLKFPEGVATAEVLKVGDQGGGGVKSLAAGGVIGALFKLGESGFGFWGSTVEGAQRVGSSLIYGGTNLLPALVAVGYIVGINIAMLVFLGGALNWFVAIPIYAAASEWPAGTSAVDFAGEIWRTRTRYIGVGAMVVGGVYALIRMGRSITSGITSGLQAYREARSGTSETLPRTEQDTPMPWVMIALIVSIIPLFLVFYHATGNVIIACVMAVIMLVAGFLFSAVASYMAGLVGSSNNPISGVTIATILMASLLLFALMSVMDVPKEGGAAAAILIGAVVCCAAAIGGDNMQDLKAGHILGATPRKQQIMQAIGVLSAAFVMAPVLMLLHKAYGIVEPAREGATALTAPQATLMASVAQGVFSQNLPWAMVAIGVSVALVIIGIDLLLEANNARFRMPVLAVAVGIYLPLELSVPIFAGGLIAFAVGRFHMQRIAHEAEGELKNSLQEAKAAGEKRGLLFAAGLITGEAMLGILLAIPIVLYEGANPLDLTGENRPLEGFSAPWPGAVLLLAVIALLYWTATRDRR